MRRVSKHKISRLRELVKWQMPKACTGCQNNKSSGPRSHYCALVAENKTGWCFAI